MENMFNKDKIATLTSITEGLSKEITITKGDLTNVAARVGDVELKLSALVNPSPFKCGDRVIYNGKRRQTGESKAEPYVVSEVTQIPSQFGFSRDKDWVKPQFWMYRLTDSRGCLLPEVQGYPITEGDLTPHPLSVGTVGNDISSHENTSNGSSNDTVDGEMVDKLINLVGELGRRYSELEAKITSNEEYENRINGLEEKVWVLTNPSKFECGDTVALGRATSELNCKVVKKKVCRDTITNDYHWGYLLTDHNDKLMDDDHGLRGIGVAEGDENYWSEGSLYVPVEAQVMPKLQKMPELDADTVKNLKKMEKDSKKNKKKLLKG